MFLNFNELGEYILESDERNLSDKNLSVYSVTNDEGFVKSSLVKNSNNYKIIKQNFLAYNPYRLNVGSIALANKNFNGAVSPAYVVFKCDETKLLSQYFLTFLKTKLSSKLLRFFCDRGSVRSAISFTNLQKLKFYIPSVQKQKLFLDKIGENSLKLQLKEFDKFLTEYMTLDKIIHNNIILGKYIKKKFRSSSKDEIQKFTKNKVCFLEVLKKKFTLPENWEVVKIGDLCHVTKLAGFEYSKYIDPKPIGDVRLIRSQNIGYGKFIEKNFLYLNEADCKKLQRSRVFGGETLLTFIGAGIGNVCVAPKVTSQLAPNVAKISSKFFDNEFITIFLTSEIGQQILKDKIKGTKDSISMKHIRDIEIFCPPISEQKDIISSYKAFVETKDTIINKIKLSKFNLSEFYRIVTEKQYSGNLIVN